MKTEFIKKHYQLTSPTIDKIEKLKKAKELENPGIKVYEKDIIVDAVDLAYSAKFGKEVFQETMSKLETMIGNIVHKILLEHLSPHAQALSKVYDQVQISKESMLLLLLANNVVDLNQIEMNNHVINNQKLEDVIEQAIFYKKEEFDER